MRGIGAPLTKFIVFIVVTVLTTGVLAVTIANAQFGGTNTYSARFTDATQVLPGDDVRIAGVRVGQVTDVEVVDRKLAEVDFEVQDSRSLPTSVTASIKFRNLVGQRYIDLQRGSGGTPGATMAVGDTIPLERTNPALDLTELFNGFKPLLRALSPKDVNTLSYEIIQVLQGEGGTVESLLAHTASLTKTIAKKDQVIGQVISNLNKALDTINQRGPQVSQLITRVQQLVSGLAQDREPIGDAISALGGLANSTSQLLEEGRKPLKEDIAALGHLTKNLNDHENIVEHFIQFLPKKTAKLTRTANYGSWFNFFVCEASVTVGGLPGVEPINLPLAPVTQSRCER